MLNQVLDLLIAILATYRLARLFSIDDGPMLIFDILRRWIGRRAFSERERRNGKYGLWQSISEGIECPFCIGVWLAALTCLMIYTNNPGIDTLLFILAIAGGQSLLQELSSYDSSNAD